MIKQLKNWLRGDADWKAEQKLNQSGKTDTFLADAMDGYRSMPEANHDQAIGQLKAKLRNRAGTTATKPTNWLSIAAAAVVVGLISIFIFTQLDQPENNFVAESKQVPSTNSATAPKTTENPPIAEEESIALEKTQTTKAEKQDESIATNTISTPKPPAVDPSNIEAGIMEEADLLVDASDPIVIASEPNTYDEAIVEASPVSPPIPSASSETVDAIVLADVPPSKDVEEGEIVAKESANISKNNVEAKAESIPRYDYSNASEDLELLTLTGIVIDENGEALIGANITLEGSNFGAVTNFDGSFNLAANATLPWSINVDYIGYESRQYTIDNLDSPLTVTLEEGGVSLDEVVVSGYSTKKKRKSKKADPPKPVIGFKKMKRYIRKNLEYPEIAKQNNIQGTVTVRFFIGEDGKPQLFSLQKTLGGGCDAEAIRLIEEGPKWEPAKTWATYTVVFNL